MTAKTMLDKIWGEHVVRRGEGEPDLLYVDLHLLNEVMSPQAFDALRSAGRKVRRPDLTLGTVDHAIPTTQGRDMTLNPLSKLQVDAMVRNCEASGIRLYGLDDSRQGIVHVIGPEQGLTQPGMVIVCGDSHTSTHGAFGTLAFGIGTSEVEHVLATQTLPQVKPRNMAVVLEGRLGPGVSAKDAILAVISRLGIAGGTGFAIEYRGEMIESLSMENRMTVCNMTIEGGARAGMIAPDDKTFEYLEGRPHAPTGTAWDEAILYWRTLRSDDYARFEKEVVLDASDFAPYVSWGTNPAHAVAVTAAVPDPDSFDQEESKDSARRALHYMDLKPGTPIVEIPVDMVFIGSCTNARIEDLRSAAEVVAGRRIHSDVVGLVVPGSTQVKEQAEAEGLDQIFRSAGFEWRNAGCSMCLGMNDDILPAGKRCASTSNRNFEGRQGKGGRTHLSSPEMAAAAAVEGHFVDIRSWR